MHFLISWRWLFKQLPVDIKEGKFKEKFKEKFSLTKYNKIVHFECIYKQLTKITSN